MNLFKKFHIGKTDDLIESPPDRRDILSSKLIPEIKRYPKAMPCPFDLTISNQEQTPSCVGHSLATIKQYNELKEREFRVFDGDWIYEEAKKIDGMPNVKGTYLRSGLSVLKNVGAKAGEAEPSKYRIIKYAKIDNITPESIKKHLFTYGAVMAGFRGSNKGWRGKIVRAPKDGEATWGHAVSLTHYEKNYIVGNNSWGEKAHDKGQFKIPLNYMPFEAWVVVLDLINVSRKEVETGFIAKKYLNADKKTVVNLNVREGAGTNYKVIKTLPRGTEVYPYGTPNVWSSGYWWMEIKL